MSNHLSEQIFECYERAGHCARKAARQPNPLLQQNYLRLEELWLNLARSYEFTQRAADFSNDAARDAALRADER